MKVLPLLLLAQNAFADLLGNRYIIDQMSEATTRGFGYANDGSHICEPGYTGSDCSLKTCPYSLAFIGAKKSEWMYTPSTGRDEPTVSSTTGHTQAVSDATFLNKHAYKECGGRGICDRTTGRCKCFPNFSGRGCKRTTCPNDCSGHGVCQDGYHSLYARTSVNQVRSFGESTQGRFWGAKKFRQCVCDRGFHGYDCSLRTCPRGDDPETECSDQIFTDRQQVACTNTGGGDAHFSLRFKDHLGGKYRTRPIFFIQAKTNAENANSIQNALEALPNFAIPTVEVDVQSNDKTGKKFKFQVDFKDGATTNLQAKLWVDTKTTCADSSQPKFPEVATMTCTVTRVAASGTLKESLECGGRGLCDTTTGICSCFKGYYGDSCSHITTYV